MRKLYSLFLLSLFGFNKMQGQLLPVVPLLVAAVGLKQKIHVFKGSKLDNSYSLIGIPADTSLVLEKFSFFINSPASIQELKKNWFVRDLSKTPPGQHLFKIYAIKDKTIKKEWLVFPLDSAIYTLEDYYKFDTSMLGKLALEHPLNYNEKIDSFSNYNDLSNFKMVSGQDDSFLFLIEPRVGFAGNFEVNKKKDGQIKTLTESTGELEEYCSKVAGNSKYAIYTRENANKSEDAGSFSYVIKADHDFYNRYNSESFSKGNWNKEPLIVKSYWRKK